MRHGKRESEKTENLLLIVFKNKFRVFIFRRKFSQSLCALTWVKLQNIATEDSLREKEQFLLIETFRFGGKWKM